MAHISSVVEIDGSIAKLTGITDSFAVIVGAQAPHTLGDSCDFTVYAEMMGRSVPVKIQGQVVHHSDSEMEVMFRAPTKNWGREVHVLKGPSALHRND